MKRINHILLLVLSLLLSLSLQGQDATLYYEVVDNAGNEHVKLYLLNNTTTDIDLGAANLSVAYISTSSSFQSVVSSLFETTWGTGANVSVNGNNATLLPQPYASNTYDSRVWYIASIPLGGSAITLPAGATAPLPVMEISFSGSGNSFYPETVAEFVGNGLTTTGLASVSFDVQQLSSPFPVEWLEFEAYPIGPETVQLDWITASELNNARFEIERSVDQLSFEQIGTVEGAGNSQTANVYDFIDTEVRAAVLYYRLRQVDFDGQFSYSEVREVQMGQGLPLGMTLFPNPAAKSIAIQINAEKDYAFDMTILDARGRIVLNQKSTFGIQDIKVSVDSFAEGVYTLKLTELYSGQTLSKMFVKL